MIELTTQILAQGTPPPAPNPLGMFLPIILMFVGFYFLILMPQRKRQKAHEAMVKSLKTGDKIQTVGGIFGVITNVKEDRVTVKVAENTRIEVGRAFVQTRLSDDG